MNLTIKRVKSSQFVIVKLINPGIFEVLVTHQVRNKLICKLFLYRWLMFGITHVILCENLMWHVTCMLFLWSCFHVFSLSLCNCALLLSNSWHCTQDTHTNAPTQTCCHLNLNGLLHWAINQTICPCPPSLH